jgi:hypothetical protein
MLSNINSSEVLKDMLGFLEIWGLEGFQIDFQFIPDVIFNLTPF